MNEFETREVTHEILNTLIESIEERAYAIEDTGNKTRVIVCECGAKILLIPDIEEMEKSIETHAFLHEKRQAFSKKAKAERCRIELLLIQKVLSSAAGYPRPL